MLGGKLKYILGGIFLLVLLVLVAEAGFYFGTTRKEKITPSVSLPFEAPGTALLIRPDRLIGTGFEFVKGGMVKGITIEVQVEGTIKEIKGPEWFKIEKDGEVMGYKVGPEEPAMDYMLIREKSGEEIPITWQDVKVGDRVILAVFHNNDTGNITSHSLTIVR